MDKHGRLFLVGVRRDIIEALMRALQNAEQT
jgi:hypothetical protein